MGEHRDIFRQIGRLALALLVCVGVMLGVYALIGKLTGPVLWGALAGYLLALGNFTALCITVSNAVDHAARDKTPKRAQLEIQMGSVIRLVLLIAIYALLFHAGLCDPIAAILPLLFAQFALKVLEFFRKDQPSDPTTEGGENTQ